ncbi:MAG: NAD-dependent epimerase/dehydratase family protein, partial [Oscillospiraceae bacterium]
MLNENSFILITGAKGFVGKNLVCQLKNLGFTNLALFDVDSTDEDLQNYVKKAEFVFHLAGVNRPVDNGEFYTGNADLTQKIITILEENNNNCPLLISSSVQAQLDNDYGKSKKMAEDAVFAHEDKTGAIAYVFRLTGVFGKWCRPNYNNVIATFCANVANGLPIEVRDPSYTFPVCYIDDVVNAFIGALKGKVMRERSRHGLCHVGIDYDVSLGFLADTIKGFANGRETLS